MSLLHKTRVVLEMIKFEHSIFALPFALTAALLALRGLDLPASQIAWKIGWIVVAMVAARSAAMAFNRVVDADIDARNPRTKMRAIPAGEVSRGFTWGFVGLWSGVFVGASAMLNPLCLKLSPAALAIVCGYSYTKRFTSLSHLVLGLALGIAPLAAWIAVRGAFEPAILLLSAAVMLWVGGFDIIYSCQDAEFDRAAGLRSIPARLGIGRALLLARLFHVAMIALLLWLWSLMDLGWAGLLGVVAVAALLAWEHSLVSADDLSKVDAAFFTVNGYVSVLFFVFWAADAALL
ncbi:MAG: UbiA family prenyltransferase [Bryobacterales bacterium]|nr:putative 4-hydroxybenzoate polyprenyltransferase [Acidobacteriota bacterium]MCB9383762.1 UbiA family prenyltransferase [Bryobacterales bacterium]